MNIEPTHRGQTLAGKIAIVTGAGQGVGRGIALACASAGASVVLVGRTFAKVESVASEVDERGGTALALAADVRSEADIDRVVTTTVERFGTVDILVNNAQEVPLGTLLDVEDSAVQTGWESGPLATLRFMRRCHPYLKGGGVIVNLGSRAGVRPDPVGRGAYAAAKEAIRALTRAAAVEWGHDGIRANVILPYAMSPALERLAHDNPVEYDRTRLSVPLGRIGDAEVDIGRAVVFLAGPDAAYLTGATIPLDGGNAFLG
jgi:NAD(P)-dependent dehydrogenase (short-subunit alcohol dehydrogenase family)